MKNFFDTVRFILFIAFLALALFVMMMNIGFKITLFFLSFWVAIALPVILAPRVRNRRNWRPNMITDPLFKGFLGNMWNNK